MITKRKVSVALLCILTALFTLLCIACAHSDIVLSFETNGGALIEPIKARAGQTVTLPEPEIKMQGDKTYIFDGWSLRRDLGGETYRGEIATPAENTTYYAKWSQAYKVSFYINGGTLDIEYIYLKEGENLNEALKNIIPTPAFGYEFDGWYLDGNKINNDTLMPKRDVTLIARYSVINGISDALGGSDFLFIKDEEPNSVYLLRQGLESKKGEYDSSTGLFVFKEGDEEILSGKIVDDRFYYFRDDLMSKFLSLNGNDRLEIGYRYAATYTAENGTVRKGEVGVDVETGYYVFKGENDFIMRFVFQTDVYGDLYFNLQNMDEEGTYLPENESYPIIYLDGLGNFTYTFDPEHPSYYDITGEPLLEAGGTYVVNEDGDYECAMSFGNTFLENFLFRVVGDHKFIRSDFYGDLDPMYHSLILNGFGEGTYKDELGRSHKGTYEIIHNWWMTFDSRDAYNTWLINFEYEGAAEDIYYAITQNNYGVVTAQLFAKVTKGEVGGLYIFDGAITLGGETYGDAFIMLVLDKPDESMVLVKISDQPLSSGSVVSVYAPMFTGTVTNTAEGIYHYQDTYEDAQMNFKIEGDKAKFTSDSGDGSLDKKTIAEGLVIDPNTSKATYTDENGVVRENLSYSYSGGDFLEFYTIYLDDTHRLYYYRDVNGVDETFTKISGKFIFDYDYETEDLVNAFPSRLLLDENSDKAYIAIPMAIGEAEYVGDGTYEKVEGSTTEYRYENKHWADNILDYFGGDGFQDSLVLYKEYYSAFTFKVKAGTDDEIGKFYERDDDMFFDLVNFKADGYSNIAKYTNDKGETLEGEFYRMETIIVFETETDKYYLKQDGGKMKNVSEYAGLYYLYTPDDVFFMTFGPDSSGELSDYIVFDGDNGVTIVNFENGYLANTKIGTMEQSENWTESFNEYIVTDETGEIYRILLGSFESIWHEEFLVYDLYSDAYGGEWYTEEGGILHGDGYRIHNASYDEDGDGVTDLSGTMVRAHFDKTDIQTHAYVEDENGDVIVFTYNVTDEISDSIIFNVVQGDGGMLYLIERKLIFGSFAFWEAGKRPGDYIYLDGNGTAELYDGSGNLISSGSYGTAPEIDEVSYFYKDAKNPDSSFYFAIYIESESTGTTYFEYRKYNADVKGEYDCDDWSHLSVGFYGEITYVDRYGVVYEGYYSVDGNKITLITHNETGIVFTFYFDRESGYFELTK